MSRFERQVHPIAFYTRITCGPASAAASTVFGLSGNLALTPVELCDQGLAVKDKHTGNIVVELKDNQEVEIVPDPLVPMAAQVIDATDPHQGLKGNRGTTVYRPLIPHPKDSILYPGTTPIGIGDMEIERPVRKP